MNKRIIKKGSVNAGLLLAVLSLVTVPGQSMEFNVQQTQVVAESQFSERTVNYKWIYKTVDGKVYKRLWDTANEKWLSDWILCE